MKLKLKAKLMMFTAAAALMGTMAHAAIDPQALAADYLKSYDYVEVKVGPTQTKVEAIKGSVKVEVIYDNETAAIVKQEQSVADAEERALVGSEVGTEEEDFEDDNGSDDSEDDGEDDSEDDSSDDSEDDSEDDSSDDSDGEDGSDDSESDDGSDD